MPANSPSADPDRRDHLAVWEYAGLMLTYWCNARCAFCYVYSGPDRGGDMSRDDAIRLWRELDELARAHGKTMRIHLAGGEPTGDWPRLVSIIRAARDAGLTRLEKVETNAFWATSDGLTRARLELLDALGMERLIISADVYHQEFIPVERVERCVRMAREVLGRGRLIVRWWDFYQQPVETRRLDDAERARAFQAALTRHQDRLAGRAAERLTDFFPLRPAAAFAGENCIGEVLHSRHVHIDPYGNIFPGVCAGIILGNAAERSVSEVWRSLAETWPAHPVVGPVVRGGSFELMRAAEQLGYTERPEGYANKCHLCSHVRQFLLDHGHWPAAVGPAECYANDRDKREAAAARELVRLTLSKPSATPDAADT